MAIRRSKTSGLWRHLYARFWVSMTRPSRWGYTNRGPGTYLRFQIVTLRVLRSLGKFCLKPETFRRSRVEYDVIYIILKISSLTLQNVWFFFCRFYNDYVLGWEIVPRYFVIPLSEPKSGKYTFANLEFYLSRFQPFQTVNGASSYVVCPVKSVMECGLRSWGCGFIIDLLGFLRRNLGRFNDFSAKAKYSGSRNSTFAIGI